jgi:hypothetical protein
MHVAFMFAVLWFCQSHKLYLSHFRLVLEMYLFANFIINQAWNRLRILIHMHGLQQDFLL